MALLLSVAGLLNAQNFTVGNLNYSVNSDGVSVFVKGHVDGTAATGALNIPGTVTYSGNDYTVTGIGLYAFKNCSGLTSLTLPNSLKSIGSQAFLECTGIVSFTIPNSVNYYIGNNAFYATGWWNNQPDGVVYKDNCCLGYKGNSSTGSLQIAEGTRLIANNAFDYCDGLTSLTFPNSLKVIGDYAFQNCTGITTINIPNSVTRVGQESFYNTAWWNNQPNGVVYKDNCCLGYKGNEPTGALEIAAGTRLIAEAAFYEECNGLTSLSLPNSLDVICNYAFKDCSGLTSIESLASTPPILYYNTFKNVNHSIPVTVPHGTLAAYQSAPYWSEFTNFVEAGGSVTTIDAIHVNGFTVPAWGAHPDFELELPSDAHCTVSYASWYREGAGGSSFSTMTSGDVFDCENCDYYMEVVLEPESGYEFAEHPEVYFNGDASVYDAGSSHLLTNGSYEAFTINYQVTQPSVNIITEIRVEGFTAPEWGAHPDFSLTVPTTHYAVDDVVWIYDGYEMEAGDVFDDESGTYYMLVYFVPEAGYAFDPNATVLFNGDASVNDADYNAILSDGTFAAYTVDYQVTSPTPSTHTITATANPAAGGTVSGGGTFNSGETCTLTATANGGYQFLNWTKNGAEVSTNATYTFTVTESAQYAANFIQSSTQTYMLTVSCDPSMGAVTGNGTYAAGTQVTVEAIAYKGYAFDSWNDGVTANPRTVTLTGNMTLVAFFKGTGVNETGATALSLYPNPAKDVLRIEGLEAKATVEIYNSLGMMVKSVIASADEEINVSDLPQGIYMLRCGKQTIRFVKTL